MDSTPSYTTPSLPIREASVFMSLKLLLRDSADRMRIRSYNYDDFYERDKNGKSIGHEHADGKGNITNRRKY